MFGLLALAALAAPRAAFAQPARKVWRIGYLSAASPEADRQWVDAFRQELRALGYIEGHNLVLDLRHTAQRPARLPEVAAELVRSAPDVLVVYGSHPVAAVQKSGLPIVMTVHADPLGGGFRDQQSVADDRTVRQFADQGMLLAYGTNFTELWRRSAFYVDKILKGAKPGDLPIEQATKFDLVINLRTAKAIGVSVPRAVLARADHLIE